MSTGLRQHVRAALTRPHVLLRDDRFWLGSAVGAGVLVTIAYLSTHPYPGYGAGLFLEMAEQISANDYRLPTTIEHYSADGVPFAYPPLFFYVAAVVRDATGVGAIQYSRIVPALFTVAYVVPFYFAARELLESTPKAGVAAVVLATAPVTLQWHLSAGGIVRAGAFLLSMGGLYTGVKHFTTGDRAWVVPSALLFGLTVLAHPVYALFFATNYLLLFAGLDRSPEGLVDGAAVAGGGLLLASPWLTHVALVHGPDTFTAAAGTHGGIGRGVSPGMVSEALASGLDLAFYAGALLVGAAFVYRRSPFLPAWFVAVGYLVNKPRFLLVPGSMMAAVVLLDDIVPAVQRHVRDRRTARAVAAAVVAAPLAVAVVTGTLHAAGALDTHGGTETQPAFVDEHDLEAMDWAEANTHPDAEFVVLGDAAEWFPHFADRTILVSPWGMEWTTPERYATHLSTFKRQSGCGTASCLTRSVVANDLEPDYVYVPRGRFTIRGFVHRQDPGMVSTLRTAEGYELVFGNEGVLVFRVTSEPTADPRRESIPARVTKNRSGRTLAP